jgi:hypothetical protein
MKISFFVSVMLVSLICWFVMLHNVNAIHNCMTAVPHGYQKYDYVPCDKSEENSSIQIKNNVVDLIQSPSPLIPKIQSNTNEEKPLVEHNIVQQIQNNVKQSVEQHYIKSTQNLVKADYSWLVYFVVGFIVSCLIFLIHVRLRKQARLQVPRYSTPVNNNMVDVFEKPIERSDGTINFVTTSTPLSDDFLQYVKRKYPRDYERILKWIAKYPEDVKIIVNNSEDYQKMIHQMVEKARKEQDWSDLK